MRRLLPFLLAVAAFGQDASQWDAAGNALLTGSHYFRQVAYVIGSPAGGISRAVALSGVIEFDGEGAYEIDGALLDSALSTGSQPFSLEGNYRIAASGYGLLSNPLIGGESIFGLVADGVFVGSATESGVNDFFIAGRTEMGGPETLQGEYRVAAIEFPDLDSAAARSAWMTLQADGAGGFSPSDSAVGYAANSETEHSQPLAGASYSLLNGMGTLTLPDGILAGGEKTLYRVGGGAVVFGGAADGWDLFVGISAAESEPAFQGLYYQAGLTHDFSAIDAGQTALDTYYGAVNASNQHLLGHQRIKLATDATAFDYTYADSFSLGADGAYDSADGVQRFIVGKEGATRLGFLKAPYMGFSLALQAPPVSADGVFLHPAGVVNAASFAPFTAGIAPGEMLTLFGAGLAPQATRAPSLPLPTMLGGIQVLIDDRPAPLVYVGPDQISAIVPFATAGPIARIRIVNNGTSSNEVTSFVNTGMPGVFSMATSGAGAAAALHSNYTLVTDLDPAAPGESIALFIAGLGAVNPAVGDGEAGPSAPLSLVADGISAAIDGQDALIQFAGLAPGFAGLYQVNILVPPGARAGNGYVDISGRDSFTSQTTVALGGSAAIHEEGGPRMNPRRPRRGNPGGLPVAPRFRWDREEKSH